jgi:uncharacterized protein YqjF (DUF2071 family)
MKPRFLTAEWRKLAIANYIVDPEILTPYLPYKTELDIWNGQCFVSLVGFRFVDTKLKGFPIPFHRHFEEVNLRFYVRFKDQNGWKRGVTFVKEIVPKHALTFIANTIYKEKYITLPMKHQWLISEKMLSIQYSWKYNKYWNSFSVQADPEPLALIANSKEEFITEHYWGYTPLTNQSCSEYQVEHPKWKMYNVNNFDINVKFDELYGNNFKFLNTQHPDSVMLAEGSEISVYSMTRIK